MDEYKDEDGELIGVEARNTYYIKLRNLTQEEYEETCLIIKEVFGRRGYLYVRAANQYFSTLRDRQRIESLKQENEELRKRIDSALAKGELKVAPKGVKTLKNRGELDE